MIDRQSSPRHLALIARGLRSAYPRDVRIIVAIASLLTFALGAGCGGPSTRTIGAATFDPTSGTAYAFEVDDGARGHDHTVVIFCNQSLPAICYRAVPQDVTDAEQMRILRTALDNIRRQRVDDAQPRTPVPAPPAFTISP
jgi:hypothetical protein